MSMDELAKKLSERGIPQSSRSTIINYVVDHILDKGVSESKNNVSNSNAAGKVSRIGSYEDVHSALSSIGQLNPEHPLVQRIQQGTDIKDPQLATNYTEHAISAMKEHANEHPEKMHSIFKSLQIRKIGKNKGLDEDGGFLHDGYDTF
jgi:hypothetical protein